MFSLPIILMLSYSQEKKKAAGEGTESPTLTQTQAAQHLHDSSVITQQQSDWNVSRLLHVHLQQLNSLLIQL